MPWWFKIAAKLALAHLPVGYRAWSRLALFRHGAMDDAGYALRVLRGHLAAGGRTEGDGLRALELGPGDSLVSALLVRAFGGRACWLIDAGDFASRDIELYRRLAPQLEAEGVAVPDLTACGNADEMLALCNARYLTDGLASLRTIPDASVDFMWSQAVLEHVRHHEFTETMRELRRILAPDGVCSHRVDLRDHLDGGLNNLRFPMALWESRFMAGSGFYTNRISMAEMLKHFRDAGFAVTVTKTDRFPTLPTPRARMAAPFRDRPEDELLVSGFNVLLRPG